MRPELPVEFATRMKRLLGAEYETFARSMHEDAVMGLRINPIKVFSSRFLSLLSPELQESLTPLPFSDCAFVTTHEKWGHTPYHHAGMIYMQDPSAMATVYAIPQEVKSTTPCRILDMCASPGGKTTQLSALFPHAVIVANEYNKARAVTLRGNVERMGCTNVVVTNLDTADLVKTYPHYFDLIVCDAPCSGEGMFRKYEQAIEEWSPENVLMCAERQKSILKNAVACLETDGWLLYSTCTFSTEENEENVGWLMDVYPEMHLEDVSPEIQSVTASGILVDDRCDYSKTRRFYPHLSPGEGQFIALFKREGTIVVNRKDADKYSQTKSASNRQKSKTSDETVLVAKMFLQDMGILPDNAHRLISMGEDVFLSPDIPLPPYGVICPGVCIGTVQKGRVDPHHQFFSAMGNLCAEKMDLTWDDARVTAYLHGEEIACDTALSGYMPLCINGVSLGGVKVSSGRAKNHYPKGIREMK